MNDHNPVSANTVFHFTKDFETLSSILENGLRSSYARENPLTPFYKNYDFKLDIGVPMVCFCDIPLRNIRNHVDIYGTYALGLTKEWAFRNFMNPVQYLVPNSILSIRLYNLLDTLDPEDNDYNDFSILEYLKPYQGPFWRDGAIIEKNFLFYNEREWRYVPVFPDDGPAKFIGPSLISDQ